jgi:hypothetical protein
MPPVILKPDNFLGYTEIVNVESGQELLLATKRVYKILPIDVHVQFWLSPGGITNRQQFHLYESITEDPLTLYVKVIPHPKATLDERGPDAS